MRPVGLTNLTDGINHLRVKGAASPGSLYDLVNAYINQEGVVRPRPGTSRIGTLAQGGGINEVAGSVSLQQHNTIGGTLYTSNPGSGYVDATYYNVPLASALSGSQNPLGTIVVAGGIVTSVTLTTAGNGVQVSPGTYAVDLPVPSGTTNNTTGAGATANVTINSSGGASAVALTAGGTNYTNGTYTNVPLINIFGGNIAQATILVANYTWNGTALTGAVETISVTNAGSNYTMGYPVTVSNNSYLGGSGSGFIGILLYSTTTAGLAFFDDLLHVFGTTYGVLNQPFYLDTLAHPNNQFATLETIWFAQPFMGFLYVVAEFNDGSIYHFWLQSSGSWNADTVYQAGTIVLPDTPNGLAYEATRALPANPSWEPNLVVAQAAYNGITSFGTITGGSGYTTGIYHNVPLTIHTGGGSGNGATADITVTSGAVSAIQIRGGGTNYTTSNTMTATLPGGTGWSVAVSAVGTVINILVPMIEPSSANGYYYVPTVYEYAPPSATNSPLNVATGATEPTWPTSVGGQVEDAGDYVQYTNSQLQAVGGTPLNVLSTLITDRYGESADVAGLSSTSTSVNTATLPLVVGALGSWKSGNNYAYGAIVTPTNTQGTYVDAVFNGNFYSGGASTTGWQTDSNYAGSWSVQNVTDFNGSGGNMGEIFVAHHSGQAGLVQQSQYYGAVTPGLSVTATCYYQYSTTADVIDVEFWLNWYNASNTLISTSKTFMPGSTHLAWVQVSATGIAPAGAAFCGIEFYVNGNGSNLGSAAITQIQWNLTQASAATQLIYQCTAVGSYNSGNPPPSGVLAQGLSGHTQPIWPSNVGGTVQDGQLTWTAIGSSVIVWTAYPIMESAASQPTFPVTPNGTVWDGSTSPLALPTGGAPYTSASVAGVRLWQGGFVWQCISRQITDANCPNTNIVALGGSHVFCGDSDIVAYCAAVNPTDWTTSNNAGYLPTGLNNYGANPVAVLGLYRSNLMVFNSGGYQMWQIDPDPANMALLDAQAVGSQETRGAQTIGTDQLVITSLGVRNVGMSGATDNMQTGMCGQPIDDLVQAQIQAGTYSPISLYYPARGQYWAMFGPQAFVATTNKPGQYLWSRYVFPDAITDWTLWGDDLYMRTANGLVWHLDQTQIADDVVTGTTEAQTVIPSGGFAQAVSGTSLTTMALPQIVTFSGPSIPSPFNQSTGVYTVVGIAGENITVDWNGQTQSDYTNGSCTMNWAYTVNRTLSSVAQVPGDASYSGNLGLANGQVVTLNDSNILPAGNYTIENYLYASGVTTFTLDTGGTPQFMSAGTSNMTWQADTTTNTTSVTIAGGGYITMSGFTDTPGGTQVEFTGSPPAPLATGTVYTLQPFGSSEYEVYNSSGSTLQILTTVGGTFHVTFPNAASNSSTQTGTVQPAGQSGWWMPTSLSTADTLVPGMTVEFSNGTGFVPFAAPGTVYTISEVAANGTVWAVQVSGFTFEDMNSTTINGYTVQSIEVDDAGPPASGYNLNLIVTGFTGTQTQLFSFFYFDYGGTYQQVLSAASATFSNATGNGVWSWNVPNLQPQSGTHTMILSPNSDSSPSNVYWQASVTFAHWQQQIPHGGQLIDKYGFDATHGSVAALNFTVDVNGTSSTAYSATATLGQPYGWLYVGSAYISRFAVNNQLTVTALGSDTMPNGGGTPLSSLGTLYVVTVDTTNARLQLATSQGGTPLQLSGAGTLGCTLNQLANVPPVSITSAGGQFGYLEDSGGSWPAGRNFYLTTNAPTPLSNSSGPPYPNPGPYYVVGNPIGLTGFYVSTTPNGSIDSITQAASNIAATYYTTGSATVDTTAGGSTYVQIGNVASAPLAGETFTVSEFGGQSLPTPFATGTVYTIESVFDLGLNTYGMVVSAGGETVNILTEGNMNITTSSLGSSIPFDSFVWWPWLDCGNMGVDKSFISFHIAGTGIAQVSFGWDENDLTAFTPFYNLDLADTVPGFPIGIGLMGKVISPYLWFQGPQNWSLEAFIMYVEDLGVA